VTATKIRKKGLTLHPMKVNDALRVMLNTKPLKKNAKNLVDANLKQALNRH
jgi:hypothetical protein